MSLFFKIKILKIWPYLVWPLDLTLYLDSPSWAQLTRIPSLSYSMCKIVHNRCAIPLIFLLTMVTFCDLNLTWSWPRTEPSIEHELNQFLPLWFRSICRKFWPKTAILRFLRPVTWKQPNLTFDLTLTWHMISFWKFRGRFKTASSRDFERRFVRLAAINRSRVRQRSCYGYSLSQWKVAG